VIFVATKKVEQTNFFSPFSFVAVFGSEICTVVRHLIHAKNFGLNMDIVDPDAFRWCWDPEL
jgi:hypothetical protein